MGKKRGLSLEAQYKGVVAALASKKTPKQLRPSLKKRKEMLKKKLGK